MGTRGFITFAADGVEKTTYNHSDSYPGGVGIQVLGWLRAARDSLDAVRERVTALRVVGPDEKPTAEDIERLARYADTGVSSRRLDDWYVLLRETQGDPHAILDAGVIEDASEFPLDSLFAEWGYVIDLDAETFEVYRGFQDHSHSRGRFAGRGTAKHTNLTAGYYPVALAASWPLSALPDDDDFLGKFGEDS
ncbi:hypothetical protein [Actinomadura rupiterrae]|uniref:hypothetical protein n=1 Tax=Actinomadura rupiterrae TaxID=559627 RepID=UPI0020A3D1C9|nr:hypothetical protein [Actinomadura rupiterrae]MCP2339233.1 hypothetical protein [Actinomadura rupiterrae]